MNFIDLKKQNPNIKAAAAPDYVESKSYKNTKSTTLS